MAEFEKWKNPTGRNFVISKKSETGEDEEEESAVSTVVDIKSLSI